jgi:hypothetical protein
LPPRTIAPKNNCPQEQLPPRTIAPKLRCQNPRLRNVPALAIRYSEQQCMQDSSRDLWTKVWRKDVRVRAPTLPEFECVSRVSSSPARVGDCFGGPPAFQKTHLLLPFQHVGWFSRRSIAARIEPRTTKKPKPAWPAEVMAPTRAESSICRKFGFALPISWGLPPFCCDARPQ